MCSVCFKFLFAVYHFDGIDTSDIKKVIMMIISVEIAGIALALVTEQTGSYGLRL